jgi:WD repeat-containing protein mio
MMAGTLAALTPQYGSSVSRNPELEKHCERLIVKLQDPYFRALLTHLTHGDWSDVLSEEIFPLRERLAIAFQFLDDKSLGSYLRRCNGDVDSLIVTGLTMSGMKILSEYVDRTADVQTAAILSSYVQYWKIGNDSRAEQWIETYRSLLDSYKLHHFRVSFDIDYGHLLQTAIGSAVLLPFNWVPRQILIRCNYCSKAISGTGSTAMGGEKVVHTLQFFSINDFNSNSTDDSVSTLQTRLTPMLNLSYDIEFGSRFSA